MADNTGTTEVTPENSKEETVASSLNASIRNIATSGVRNFRIRNPPNIHQISDDMRKENKSAYSPRQFPIGPYHRHEDKLLFLNGETNGIKVLYLDDLLRRNPTQNKLENYASAIESREEEARDCYHDRCKGFQSKDFVEMMVLDGCFIVEFFLKCWERPGRIEEKINESWIRKSGHIRDLVHDLMLMENQIPFFILRLILDNSQYRGEGVAGNLGILDLALNFLYSLECYAGQRITTNISDPIHLIKDERNIYHLLHLNYLCHMVERDPEMRPLNMLEKLKWVLYWVGYVFLWPIKHFLLLFYYALIFFLKFIKLATEVITQQPNFHNILNVIREQEERINLLMLPTATELNDCGVKFNSKKNARNYMDVSFKNGIMEIPFLTIDDNKISAFRNFLALEYFCPDLGYKFTTYVIFLDKLIDTTSDVSFLKNRKIIENQLGSDEAVAKLLNAMTDGLVGENHRHYPFGFCKAVLDYWKKDRNRWRAMMMRNYFSSPWSAISLLGAFTLLAFTAVQVYYAIKTGRSP